MKEKLRQRVLSCSSLPSLPGVAVQLIELCRDEDVDLRQVADLLRNDPALSAKVLKVVNSPFYGLRCQVSTLSHAFALLGLNSVRTLALSFSLVSTLKGRGSQSFDYHSYWRRSLISAVAAKTLGSMLEMENVEELFLAGLLQDIGMPVYDEVLPGAYEKLVRASRGNHTLLYELERENIGVDHAEVGGWLAEKWNLPAVLRAAIHGSHTPDEVETSAQHLVLVQAVSLSGRLSEIWLRRDTEEALVEAYEWGNDYFDLDRQGMQEILASVASAVPEISSFFEMEVVSTDQINEILNQAKEMLVTVNLSAVRQADETRKTVDQLADENQTLKQKTQRDPLTGLFNRAYLDAFLEEQFQECRSARRPLSLLFCDIDSFKQINDTYGHQLGDHILVSVARIMEQQVSSPDVVARYGGEEFVAVLPGKSMEEVAAISHRIREAVAEARHGDDEQQLEVTVSIGHASQGTDSDFETLEALVAAADQCLYQAKNTGRNRVVGFHEASKPA